MRIHRTLMKEGFQEDDGDASNWTEDENGGSIGIGSFVYYMNAAIGGCTCRAHYTNAISQTLPLEYYFKTDRTNRLPDSTKVPDWGFYFYSSSTAGSHYGNGYLVRVEMTYDDIELEWTSTLRVYKVQANVIAEIGTGTDISVEEQAYEYIDWKITYDPTTGAIKVYTRTWAVDASYTLVKTATDTSPITSGSYIAFRAYYLDMGYAFVAVRRPDSYGQLTSSPPDVLHKMGNYCDTLAMNVHLDSTTGTTEWTVGDQIEVILEGPDGDEDVGDFDGRVDKITVSENNFNARIEATDWRGEALKAEGLFPSASMKVSDIMRYIIANNLTVLKNGRVKATADAAQTRDLKGKYAMEALWGLCMEKGYSMWQSFWRGFYITNSWNASGKTINNTDDKYILSEYIEDGRGMVNKIIVYWGAGGGTRTAEDDAGSQGTYGVQSGVMIDPTIPAAGNISDLATNVLNALAGNYKTVDVWYAGYEDLQVGDTVTLTIAPLKISAASGLVIEKAYGPGVSGFRFRCVVSPYFRDLQTDVKQVVARIGMKAQNSLAYQL